MAPRDHRHVTRVVAARAGIAGNPSDGYGGRVVATTIGQLVAQVSATEAPAPATGEAGEGGGVLLDAARTVAEGWLRADAGLAIRPSVLSFTTDIPRQVGLAGSSAIVVGAIEALAALHGVEPDPTVVARLALRAEVDIVGVQAGPQDRVVQAHRGVLDMDFETPWDPGRYHRLPDGAVTGIVVAWHPEPGTSSGVVHQDLRERWAAGDPTVTEVMATLAHLAGSAAEAMRTGDRSALAAVVDETRRQRRRIQTMSPIDEHLLAVADAAGAAANLAGSGGAIVAVPRTANTGAEAAASLCDAFAAAGLRALVPRPQVVAAAATPAPASQDAP